MTAENYCPDCGKEYYASDATGPTCINEKCRPLKNDEPPYCTRCGSEMILAPGIDYFCDQPGCEKAKMQAGLYDIFDRGKTYKDCKARFSQTPEGFKRLSEIPVTISVDLASSPDRVVEVTIQDGKVIDIKDADDLRDNGSKEVG